MVQIALHNAPAYAVIAHLCAVTVEAGAFCSANLDHKCQCDGMNVLPLALPLALGQIKRGKYKALIIRTS